MSLYKIYNGPMPTTVPMAKVATGTATKTLLQLKPFNVARLVEWGLSFDGSAAGVPIQCELIDTGTVFATVTASLDADIVKFGGRDQAVASVAGLTLGTAATGYTSTSEGAITTTALYDLQNIAPTNQYIFQFPLGREAVAIIGNSVRIRVTAPVSVNATAYMLLDI